MRYVVISTPAVFSPRQTGSRLRVGVFSIALFVAVGAGKQVSAQQKRVPKDVDKTTFYMEATKSAVENAKREGVPAREISERWVYGAGQCRDSGAGPDCAIPLFEEAIKADPTNARAHQTYADYLSFGYLGRYEEAMYHFQKAHELLKKNPKDHDPALVPKLNRSLAILHRDAKDGVPLLMTRWLTLSATPNGDIRRRRRPLISLGTQFMDAEELYIQENRGVSVGFDRETIRTRVPLNQDKQEFNAGLLLRFNYPRVPFIRYWYQYTKLDPFIVPNFESLGEPLDTRVQQHGITIGERLPITHRTVLYGELVGLFRNTKVDDFLDGERMRIETEDARLLNFAFNSTTNFGLTVFQVFGGGAIGKHENRASDNDRSNRLDFGLRLSRWPKPNSVIASSALFQGRRSVHYEVGASRTFRSFKSDTAPTVTETRYRPYALAEFLGMAGGPLDLVFGYRLGRVHTDGFSQAEKFNTHFFEFIPTFEPVYRLYDPQFTTGLENVRISFPLRAEIGKGQYDRVRGGLRLEQRFVTRRVGFRLAVGAEYGYFTELNEDAHSVFVSLEMESGHIKK